MSVTKVPICLRFNYNKIVGTAEFEDEFLEKYKELDWVCSLGYRETSEGKELLCLGVVSDKEYEEYVKSTKSV